MANLSLVATSGVTQFNFDNHTVRTIVRNGDPWFVAADVCDALTIGNNRDTTARLDDDEKDVGSIDTPSGRQEMTIVNESGLYSLILGSRKPEAKRFKKWVTSEVLPSIRKTGRYELAKPIPVIQLPDFTNPAIAARAWADQVELKMIAENVIRISAPKVELVDNFLSVVNGKTGEVIAKELAKEFDIGRTRLYAFLRDSKIFNSKNIPRQCQIDAGRFYLQPSAYETEYGAYQSTSVRFTAKGEFHVRALLQKAGYAKRIAA